MNSSLDKLTNALDAAHGDLLRYIAIAAVCLVVSWIAWRIFQRRKRPAARLQSDLKLEVTALPELPPPASFPLLELYNLPVRLAAIVVAPVGVGQQLPPSEQLGPLLDAVLPGLDKVASTHCPVIRRWPTQVSARGFAYLFFANARLPGDAGKGTPWSSVAGVARVQGHPVMVGLVLHAVGSNSLGQTIIDAEYKWLGCLRVRWS